MTPTAVAQPRRKGGVAVIAIIKDRNTPGALAEELSRSKEKTDAKINAARESHAAVRNGIVQRGTQRIREIANLQAELETERRDLDQVVKSA